MLHAAGVTSEREELVAIAAVDDEVGGEIVVQVSANGDPWVTSEWVDADSLLNDTAKPLYRRLNGNYDFT